MSFVINLFLHNFSVDEEEGRDRYDEIKDSRDKVC